jgi:hypothetical protein
MRYNNSEVQKAKEINKWTIAQSAESRRIEKFSPTLVVLCMPSQEKFVATRCQTK